MQRRARRPLLSTRRRTPFPPQNLQAERCVLGGELLDSGQIDGVRALLKPEDFYSDIHATMQRVLNDLCDSNAPVDVETVANALESRGELTDIGGPPYLMELLNAVPHTAHTETYAKQVQELSRRRAAVNLGRDLMANAHDKTQAADDVLNAAETQLHGLIEGGIVGGPKSIGDILLTVLANSEQADEGIPTGFDAIDHLTGGLRPGAVVVIAARPSMGKTALACGVLLTVARNGSDVLMATYEQPAKEITQRLLSSRAGTPWESLRSSPNILRDVFNEVGGWPIQIDDSGHDIGKLVATIRLAARNETQVVIVDYLQLVPPDDPSVNREQQVASSSRKLKQVAMACNVCVTVLSQLNRQVENRPDARPRLSDLRELGTIGQDADQTWLLWRPNKGSTDQSDTVASIDIAKNRNGPTGLIQLDWHGPTSTFHNPVSPVVEW